MNIGVGYIVVGVKQVLLPNITMMKLDKKTTPSKRCDKNQAKKMGALKWSNEDIDVLLEEIHRREKLDEKFDIEYDHEDTNGD